jgi:hypothetical protein
MERRTGKVSIDWVREIGQMDAGVEEATSYQL